MEPTEKFEKEVLFQYLDQTLTTSSAKLVGKTLKRFELLLPEEDISNVADKRAINLLKKEIKELIYESFREMRDVFTAYNYGLETFKFEFLSKKKELV